MTRIVVVMLVLALCIPARGQRKGDSMRLMKPPKGTICFASTENAFTNVGPPAEYLRSRTARTKTANIIVEYDGFTQEAQDAFQAAVDIWESILETPVTIHVEAHWTTLGQGILGSASPGTYSAGFPGAPKEGVWYPVALAEKIAGKELNGTDPDIVASFNSANDAWHFGLADSPPPAGTYDLVSIVLHEIGHGLGITHGYDVVSGMAVIPDYFNGLPVVYETNIRTSDGKNFVNDFALPSAGLKSEITNGGGGLSFSSPLVRAANSNANGILYAPTSYNGGSSIAHLDETTYPAGSANSLMTPFIAAAERILDPGPISRNILREIGWTVTVIEHTPLKNTESTTGPFTVVGKIVSDNGYDATSVLLNYQTTGALTNIPMTATGNADEFSADLPVGSKTYGYYISVSDNAQRSFTTPGVIIQPGSAPQQDFIVFESGPDTKPPVINHTPKEFITTNDNLDLQAIVSDNIGVQEVTVQWEINGVAQLDQAMVLVPNTDSTYADVIHFPNKLQTGDKVQYRIRAVDSSLAHNVAFKPSSTTFFEVNVTGLGEVKDSYSNDFDNLSTADFFGNGFTVSTPAGFNNGAIHSDHPYAEGGAAGAHVDLIYNLKTPIRITSAAANAIMKFDEIVLVEPGEPNVPWPDENFYDYVVVEGSVDGGLTWQAVADGYDCRLVTDWLNLWNSTISGNNSTGSGTASMYRSHTFNLLDKFKAGDEVAFRFRLFSDPFSAGWGWSIDNLKIQIDDTPPTIRHQHYDYVLEGAPTLDLNMSVKDANDLDQIFVDYIVNTGSVVTTEVIVNPATDNYVQKIAVAGLNLKAGDVLHYRIRATDKSGNEGSFPATDFINTTVVSFASSVDQIVDDFTSTSSAFVGNFFNVSQPTAFTSSGMNTNHPYDVGLGPDSTSNFSFLTKTPVKVTSLNPMIYYEDVALVEYHAANVKDYVVVEASKDGVTWEQLVEPYTATAVNQWRIVFDNNGNGSQALVQPHYVRITEGGKFADGDIILIRFRLFSDKEKAGWGWFVDNLSIQGPITGVEPTVTTEFEAWPNPVANGPLYVKMMLPQASDVNVEILTMQGQLLSSERFSAPSGESEREYQASNWANGFYVVKVRSDFGTAIKKIIKLNSQN